MNDDYMQNDPNHRKRVENFHLNISDEEYEEIPELNQESVSVPLESGAEKDSDNVIHSYSDPLAAQQSKLPQENKENIAKAEKAHRWRNKQKGKKNRFFYRVVWLIMVLIFATLLSQFMITGINDMLAVGREKVTVTVEMPKNPTVDQVANILNKAGIIQDVNFFKLYSKLTKADKFNNGSYKIDTNMDYQAIITNLQSSSGRVDTVKITFPEGINVIEIANLFEKNGVCSAKDALSVMNSNKFDTAFEIVKAIPNAKDRYYKLEGYLFPDTYDFYRDEDPDKAIQKLISNSNKKLTTDIRNKASAKKMTVDQLLTLASMIQAEAASKEDMYNISSIFHNRLASGTEGDLQRLRSDATTYYPYRTKATVPSNIRETYKSKYDTYTIKGLPAGPICSPGADAIDAALNPANTKYYYFCHSSSGKAFYARTLSEHNANRKKAGLT